MYFRLYVVGIALCLTGYSCKTAQLAQPFDPAHVQAAVAAEGLLTCFPVGTSLDNKPVWCEASAVLFDGKTILVANDKEMPTNLSPILLKTPANWSDTTQSPGYLIQPTFAAGRKYEDFSQTPDGKFVLLTTAFDRVKPDSHDWDAYNTILYWRKGDEQHPHVLMPSGQNTTSVGLRQKLARALATAAMPDVPYFKIEGLAATDRQLLFGIREVGKAFDNFTYASKIVAVSYTVGKINGEDRIQLFDDWRVVADYNPAARYPSLPKPMGLSSLEYDPIHRCVWMLTSYEKDGKFDSYAWTNTLANMKVGKPFQPVRGPKGKPLHLSHKAEDITLLSSKQLLVIHDDDRVQTTVGKLTRQPNQAAYSIVAIQ